MPAVAPIPAATVGTEALPSTPTARTYLSTGVFEEGGSLVFAQPGRPTVTEPLNGWHVSGQLVGELVGLVRPVVGGAELRVFNSGGHQVGSTTLPAGRMPIITDKGIITLVEALHSPVRPHEIAFYKLDGAELRIVREPDLGLVTYMPLRDGRLVTVSQGPASDDRAIIVYDVDGRIRWRYHWKGPDVPRVVVTPDNSRLVLARPDVLAGTVTITVLQAGNQTVQTHELALVNEAVASDDSRYVALVGQSMVAMLDAHSGSLVWRTDLAADLVLAGGVRFDHNSRLLVVSAQRERNAGQAHIWLHSLSAADGATATADLGTLPLDAVPRVVAVDMDPNGQWWVLLEDRRIDVALQQ